MSPTTKSTTQAVPPKRIAGGQRAGLNGLTRRAAERASHVVLDRASALLHIGRRLAAGDEHVVRREVVHVGPDEPPDHGPDDRDREVADRQWRLRDAELWFADARWTRGTNTAHCAASGAAHAEAAPGSACSCGLYAWYRPCPRLASAATAELVAGAVALWGTIELHATGMRAQHAMVVALALPLARAAEHGRVGEAAAGCRRARPHASQRSTSASACRVTAASYSTPQNEQRTRMPACFPAGRARRRGRLSTDRRAPPCPAVRSGTARVRIGMLDAGAVSGRKSAGRRRRAWVTHDA
jgi:hypothetical protein